MLAISTLIGIVILATGAIALAKFAKDTIVTILAVAGVIIGLFLIFGPTNIPYIEDYVNTDHLQDLIPGTGSATYSPYDINITSTHIENGLLVVEVKNTGDVPLSNFEIIVNEQIGLLPVDAPKELKPQETALLHTDFAPSDGDIITVIASGVEDTEVLSLSDAS